MRQRTPADGTKRNGAKLRIVSQPPIGRDRDVVKMARMILAHFPNDSKQAAHSLLMSAAKPRE